MIAVLHRFSVYTERLTVATCSDAIIEGQVSTEQLRSLEHLPTE